MILSRVVAVTAFVFLHLTSLSQHQPCDPPATIILFRTFDFFNFKFSYKLFAGDSLLGRMKEHDVFIIDTYDPQVSFHTTVKAPSVNAGKRGNYQKIKKINYPFSVKPGGLYLVKCGFLKRDLFEYPRQPTIELLKDDQKIRKYLRKRYVRKKIRDHAYGNWVIEKDVGKIR